jgi:hypothetical protein
VRRRLLALALLVTACGTSPTPTTAPPLTTSPAAGGSTVPSAPVLGTPDGRGATPSNPEPTLVALATQPPPPRHTPAPCMGALTIGVLVADDDWGIALAGGDGSVLPVVWAHGYSGRWDGNRLALVDGAGSVLAYVGDRVEVGGGSSYVDFGQGRAGEVWIACSDVKVSRPVDPAIEPVSRSNPTRAARVALERCNVETHGGLDKVAGMGLIPDAHRARDYAPLSGLEPELKTGAPAWMIQFSGEIPQFFGGEVWIDPICVLVVRADGTLDGGMYGTGPVRHPGGSLSTPEPLSDPPQFSLPSLAP